MKTLLCIFVLQWSLYSAESQYTDYTKNIINDLNYIYQGKTWTGASTYVKARKFRYDLKHFRLTR